MRPGRIRRSSSRTFIGNSKHMGQRTAAGTLISLLFRGKRQQTVLRDASLPPLSQPHQRDGRRRFYLAVRG
jgi:hypothetical protein